MQQYIIEGVQRFQALLQRDFYKIQENFSKINTILIILKLKKIEHRDFSFCLVFKFLKISHYFQTFKRVLSYS
jgi:hypothetical protein